MLVETFVLNRYKCIGKIFWNGVNGLVDTVGSGFSELPQILTVRCCNHLGFISAWFDTGRSDLWRIVNDLLDEKTAAYGTDDADEKETDDNGLKDTDADPFLFHIFL